MNEEVKYTVYGLVDPRHNETFYVGVTKRPLARLRDHLNPRCPRSKALDERLIAIEAAGAKPDMVILERCGREEVHSLENHYIDVLRDEGAPLVNQIRNGKRPRFKSELSDERRRALTLAAISGQSPSALANEYSVSRSLVYQLKDAAIRDYEVEYLFWANVKHVIEG